MKSRRRVIRGISPAGTDVPLVLDLSPDHLIGLYARTDDAVLFSPRQISVLIDHLRELQALALEGVTWPEPRIPGTPETTKGARLMPGRTPRDVRRRT